MRRTVLVVVVTLALVVAAVVLALQLRERLQAEQAREDALAVAEGSVVEVLSYDHRRLDADVAEAERLSTGRFLEQYRSATRDLAEQARAGSVVVTARVPSASVQAATPDEVVVLLFVDQTTERADLPEPRVDQNRVRLTMQRVGGRWLVAELDVL